MVMQGVAFVVYTPRAGWSGLILDTRHTNPEQRDLHPLH